VKFNNKNEKKIQLKSNKIDLILKKKSYNNIHTIIKNIKNIKKLMQKKKEKKKEKIFHKSMLI
jgi:hypothetical protein